MLLIYIIINDTLLHIKISNGFNLVNLKLQLQFLNIQNLSEIDGASFIIL